MWLGDAYEFAFMLSDPAIPPSLELFGTETSPA